MARQRYPSDDRRRKQRPHVKVHLSIRSHPKYAAVLEDPERRGIWLGLLLLGVQYHAAKTDDVVSLGLGDLVWLSGRTQRAHAERAVCGLCERMDWSFRRVDRRYEVRLRNLEHKQGFASATPPVATPDSAPSEEQKNRGTEEPTPTAETAATRRPESWALDLSDLLIEKIRPIAGARIPTGSRTRWAREIERLVAETESLKNQSVPSCEALIRRGIDWAFSDANLGIEYEVVVRSGAALRAKWSKLVEAKKRADGKRSVRSVLVSKRQSEHVFGSREWCEANGRDFDDYQREAAEEAERRAKGSASPAATV